MNQTLLQRQACCLQLRALRNAAARATAATIRNANAMHTAWRGELEAHGAQAAGQRYGSYRVRPMQTHS